MESFESIVSTLGVPKYWLDMLKAFGDWASTTLASTDTTLEIAVIIAATLIAWPLSKVLHAKFDTFATHQAQYPILQRLWQNLSKVAFPIAWLFIQWIADQVLTHFGFRDGLLHITSSLLTAWIAIRIISVFVANPLVSSFVAFFAWSVAALNIVGLLDTVVAFLDKSSFKVGNITISAIAVVEGIVALAVLLWLTSVATQLIESRIKATPHLTPSIKVLSTKILRITLSVVALLLAMGMVGIDFTAIAVFSGAIGVGLGFGLQTIFSNLVSGFILLFDKSIKPGDVIAVGPNYGTVHKLGARYVSVLTRDGIEHLIPNEELITTQVESWSHSHSLLRLHKVVGVHYDSDVHKAIALCTEAMLQIPRIMSDPPPTCLMTDFADSSVNLELRYWIKDPMNGCSNVTSQLLLLVWEKFHEHGIEIPYPQHDLHIKTVTSPPLE